MTKRRLSILLAEDDPDDRLLVKEALQACSTPTDLRWVEDGEQLMDYLHRRGDYVNEGDSPRPNLILLDLNMPRKDGREAAREIKADPEFRQIPIVVLTSMTSEYEVFSSYDAGVNSFIVKAGALQDFFDLIEGLSCYWYEVTELPNGSLRELSSQAQ